MNLRRESEIQNLFKAKKAQQVLSAISPNDSLTMNLHYFQNLSIEETAEQLGYAKDTVKKRLARGTVEFRRILTWADEVDEIPPPHPGLELVNIVKTFRPTAPPSGYEQVLPVVMETGESSFDFYNRKIHRFPVLSPEQEIILFEYMKKSVTLDFLKRDAFFWDNVKPEDDQPFVTAITEGESIRDLIANCNLRLVVFRARNTHGWDLDERVAEGNIGLLDAIEKFDIRRGFKFSTYAVWYIDQAIKKGKADKERTIRLPIELRTILSKASVIAADFQKEKGYPPEPAQLAELMFVYTDFSESAIERAIQARKTTANSPAYLSQPVSSNTDSGGELGDFIADDAAFEEMEAAADNADSAQIRLKIKERLQAVLSDREVEILLRRNGLNGQDEKLSEIGRYLGLSRERVRQLERDARSKILSDPELRTIWLNYSGGATADRSDPHISDESAEEKPKKPALIQDPRLQEIIIKKAMGEEQVWSSVDEESRQIIQEYFHRGLNGTKDVVAVAQALNITAEILNSLIVEKMNLLRFLIAKNAPKREFMNHNFHGPNRETSPYEGKSRETSSPETPRIVAARTWEGFSDNFEKHKELFDLGKNTLKRGYRRLFEIYLKLIELGLADGSEILKKVTIIYNEKYQMKTTENSTRRALEAAADLLAGKVKYTARRGDERVAIKPRTTSFFIESEEVTRVQQQYPDFWTSLNQDQRTILQKFYLENTEQRLTQTDVAAQLNVHLSSVVRRRQAGLKIIKTFLAEHR